MTTLTRTYKKFSFYPLLLAMIAIQMLQGCATDSASEEEEVNGKDIIKVTTKGMEFILPDTITSGWNTFEYTNNSSEVHFILFDKYPENKTIEDAKREVIPVFQNGMDSINAGKLDEGYAEFGKLPAWFGDIVFTGGTGLVSPKRTGVSTLKLEPGYYVMECYLKMANGVFHATMGMTKALVVLEENSGHSPPEATVNITISSTEGINYDTSVTKGEHIFSVHFIDQVPHEHFVGHDVSLVKIKEQADLNALEKWMDWSDPKGLITPAPQGFTFLGGVNDSPEGSTGYFKATLEPGKYAFISEVPNASSKNMLRVFDVAE